MGAPGAALLTLLRGQLDETAQGQVQTLVLGLLIGLPLAYALTPGYRGSQGCAFGCSLWMVMLFSAAIVSGILGSVLPANDKAAPRPGVRQSRHPARKTAPPRRVRRPERTPARPAATRPADHVPVP